MTDDERRAFLMHGTRTGKLALTRKDGTPIIAAMWFLLDGDDLILHTGADSIKGKSLLRDGRVAFIVDDDEPPFSYVMIQGVATVSEDPDELLAWSTKLGGRYMGADRAEEFGKRNGVPGELLVRITPTKTVALKSISD